MTFSRIASLLVVSTLVACGSPPPPAHSETPAPSASATTTAEAPATTTDLPASQASAKPLAELPPPATSAKPSDAPLKASEPGRTAADIQTAVQTKRADARACFDEGVKKTPTLTEGDLVMNFVIATDGVVKSVEVDPAKSQITDPTVVACVAKVLSGLSFPKSSKGYETRGYYPFNFKKKMTVPAH